MNQPASSVRCPHCNLINFASEPFCKRCKISLQNAGQTGESNTININISFPSGAQPRINAQPNADYQNNAQFRQTTPTDFVQSSEYRLQNQTGFEQWQQSNQNFHAPVFVPPSFAPPAYPVHSSPVVWRRGGELITHRYAGTLPDRCVKCNEQISGYAAGARVTQKFRWHNPLVYIALISPLIYVILSLVLSQRVQLDVPLCSRHLEARKSTGKTLLGGSAAAAAAIFFFASFGYVGFSFLLFLAALIGIVYGYEYSYKPLQIAKIENDYIYLKNAGNEYLNNFPGC